MTDGITISETTESISVVVTQNLSMFRLVLNAETGEYEACAEYSEFTRRIGESGTVVSARVLKAVNVPWARVIVIAPAMATAREQLNAALPALLAS